MPGGDTTWTGYFKCRKVKTGFCRNRSMQSTSSGTLIRWKSGQTTFVPLWDRMEGAWLRTLETIVWNPLPPDFPCYTPPSPSTKKPVQQAPSPSWFLFLTPTKARATGTLSLLVSFATPLLVLNKMKRFHIGCENPVLVPCFISHSEQCWFCTERAEKWPSFLKLCFSPLILSNSVQQIKEILYFFRAYRHK
jgi:hypothetical protein